ncbi:hypothetical protein [Mycoplasma suis]|uniref:Uncharacterized protein n=2 Tax=Mycoplasma suis TaxID=57372 RepID=F0QS11_MYCSL|nr:hypothetical protein [Mycoplasma suis]ADX98281.1 hypothetical protein MSU_0756 [Mycoplasma suis str. Illinois]CBZ40797.1 hypothetical protein MSUIS_07040 [Mycoplasma suis KI3806]
MNFLTLVPKGLWALLTVGLGGGGAGYGVGAIFGESNTNNPTIEIKKEVGEKEKQETEVSKQHQEVKVTQVEDSNRPKSRTIRSVNTQPAKSYRSLTLEEKNERAKERFLKKGWVLWEKEQVMKHWEKNGDNICDYTKYLDGDLRPVTIVCYKAVDFTIPRQ